MNCELSKYLLKSFNCKNVTGGGSFNPPSSQSEGHHKAEAFSPAGAQGHQTKENERLRFKPNISIQTTAT